MVTFVAEQNSDVDVSINLSAEDYDQFRKLFTEVTKDPIVLTSEQIAIANKLKGLPNFT